MKAKKNAKVKVAVYGTLMDGERNAHWRDGIPTLVEATVEGALFDTGYGFPAIVPKAGTDKVAVEVLETDAAGVANMDILEGYPRLYRREAVTYTTADGTSGEALVYVMNAIPSAATHIEPKDGVADWRLYRQTHLL